MNRQPQIPSVYKNLRALRREREISQLVVATKLGISQSQFSLIEKGYIQLSKKLLRRICKILGTNIADVTKGGRANEC